MTDWLLALVPQYGLWLLALTTYASCLALPLPASLLMLTAGGFVAAGDLEGWQVAGAALAGAVAGDLTGYQVGRRGGTALLQRLGTDPVRAKLIDRATVTLLQRGGSGIFLTRWLLSPLGPYANFVAGAIAISLPRFAVAVVLGEAIWVGLYVGLGYGFAGNIEAASGMAGSVLGVAAGFGAALGLGLWLRATLRAERETESPLPKKPPNG